MKANVEPGTILGTIGSREVIFDGLDKSDLPMAHIKDGETRYKSEPLASITARLGAYISQTKAGESFKVE